MTSLVRKPDDVLEIADLPNVLPNIPQIIQNVATNDESIINNNIIQQFQRSNNNQYNKLNDDDNHDLNNISLSSSGLSTNGNIQDDDTQSSQSFSINDTNNKHNPNTHKTAINTNGLDQDGQPILFSRFYFAIIIQYIAVGLYYSCMSGLGYSIFSNLLGLKSFQVKGSIQFVNLWWSFKTFFACISDCIPIGGYRRKWYVLIGWVLAGICTLWAIALGQPQPTDNALKYIIAFSMFTLFYLIADCAMDGFIIDYAMKEPIERRGSLQSTIYFTRYLAMTASGLIIALGFNSKEYGGTWSVGLTLPQYLWFLFIVNAIGWPFYYWLNDTPGYVYTSYFQHFVQIFNRLKLCVIGKIVLFSFFVHIFAYVSNAASYDIQHQFCHVTPLFDALGGQFFAYIVMAIAIYTTKHYLLNVSWHYVLTVCILLMAILTYIQAIVVDFDIIRSPYFYVFAPLLTQFVSGVFFIVCALCATEVAEKGYEGITFGLLTTINNITNPLSVLFSANIASFFDIYGADGRTLLDTTDGRWELFKLDTTIFFVQLCSLFALLLLPKQKIELQWELKQGQKSDTMAIIIAISMIVCFLWSIFGNFAQSSSFSCLKIVGGSGCH